MSYDLTILENGCAELGIELAQQQKDQYIQYYEYLIEKNKVMNLTGITEFQEVLTKHFLDSLSCVKAVDMTKVKTIIDIGTGAGFPGIPLKIAFPEEKSKFPGRNLHPAWLHKHQSNPRQSRRVRQKQRIS